MPAWSDVFAPNYGVPDLTLVRGKGAHVWDADGQRYLDFLAGIAVTSTGHAHPRVVAAICEQAGRLLHTSNLYANEPSLALAERLTRTTGYAKAFFANSGSEVNEFALKLVRRHAHRTGRQDGGVVLAFTGGFHGRTAGALALTGRYLQGFGPLPQQIVHVAATPEAVEAAFSDHDVVGVFAEFVQGEGGVRPLPQATVEAIERGRQAHDALLVADEIQTGVGRTGRFLAQEHYGIKADITTLAKGLASGVPIGATLMTDAVAGLVAPGDHGSTFGGNPIACAAALSTLDLIEQEGLMARAASLGERLRSELHGARGLGLLVGLDVADAAATRKAAQAEGLLVGQIGVGTLRLAPPLIIDETHVDTAVDVLRRVRD